jgi:hypothetical protein
MPLSNAQLRLGGDRVLTSTSGCPPLDRDRIRRVAIPNLAKKPYLIRERSIDIGRGAASPPRTAERRPRLMHDGLSLTIDDAIRRHKRQAEGVELKYEALCDEQKKQLIAFLNAL